MINQNINARWYKSKNPEKEIFDMVTYLERQCAARRTRQNLYVRLYSNYDNSNILLNENRIKLNVISAITDSITSKITKQKPKVVLLPNKGDWNCQKKSKKLERFIAGCFNQSNVYDEATKMFLDVCTIGTGFLKVFSEEDEIKVERVKPQEITIDDNSEIDDKPRSIYQRKNVSRDVLQSLFPEYKKEIGNAAYIFDNSNLKLKPLTEDLVTVIEAWHLKSSKEANDGKHIICVDTCVLLEEDYDLDDYPFVFMNWKTPHNGLWGTSICDDVLGIQIEINTLLQKIQKSMQWLSDPMVFINSASAISKPYMAPNIGVRIVPYTGQPPQIAVAQTVHPEIFKHLDFLYSKAFQITGVSMMGATSQKPGGLNSGAAIREFTDIESERFAALSKKYENLFIELAKKMILEAKALYENKSDYSVNINDKTFVESIKWSDTEIEEDKYSITVGASSSLPDTKAGRIETASEWLQQGAITIQEYRELVDIPDIDGATSLFRARRDYIRDCVQKIIEDEVFTAPEESDDLAFAREYTASMYAQCKNQNAPDEVLELLSQYIESVNAIIEMRKQQQEAMAQAAQPPMPMADMQGAAPQTPMAPIMPPVPGA